jgi:hypothetical protein
MRSCWLLWEEHTNYPFRLLMKQYGAALVCTERLDAAGVARRDRRAMKLLFTSPQEAPRAGQISGADPAIMAEAARVVEERGFNFVDLNFECPIKRLLGRNEGGALMSDPRAIGKIVAAVVHAVAIPVTLKIRSGPDSETETAVEVARRAAEAGAAAVDVHGRSVRQAYVGGPDWAVVARVKQAVRVPVLGSGGIRMAHDAVRYSVRIRGGRCGNRPRVSGQPVDLPRSAGARERRLRNPASDSRRTRSGPVQARRRRIPAVRNGGGHAPVTSDKLLLCQIRSGLCDVSRGGASRP